MSELMYDWDDYEAHFKDKPAYEVQEAALVGALATEFPKPTSPASVFEVGPGFGRITALVLARWPKTALSYTLLDVSEAMIEATSSHLPSVDFHYVVGPLQARQRWQPQPKASQPQADLVLAVEVLMHIPPDEVREAISNLLLGVEVPGGCLITCDWTSPHSDEPLVQNWRHDYPKLFYYVGARTITSLPVGRQTIYVVRP